ncbi:hypothetical protein Pcinc_013070 [Petrolisthes cinctipes]|uniref:HAT C-terminal dimerisation domain-containing protein n=1 Tax=Petrolisthes cinctipes TaxID=88211 RepID=A0AAE1FZM7_PETCI|nr:hypothetical protein Pcinc_013070 [Petrolisthes cinctipes]
MLVVVFTVFPSMFISVLLRQLQLVLVLRGGPGTCSVVVTAVVCEAGGGSEAATETDRVVVCDKGMVMVMVVVAGMVSDRGILVVVAGMVSDRGILVVVVVVVGMVSDKAMVVVVVGGYAESEPFVSMSINQDEAGMSAKRHRLFAYMPPAGQLLASSSTYETTVVKAELETYLEGVLPFDVNQLRYWRDTKSFKILKYFAKNILGCCATSASSERVFCKAGNFYIPEQAKLGPETFRRLINDDKMQL